MNDDTTIQLIGKIWDRLGDLPTRAEVREMIDAKSKTDWKTIAKIVAIIIPSGGIGAAASEIIKAFSG